MADFSTFSGIGRYGTQPPLENAFLGTVPMGAAPAEVDIGAQVRQAKLQREQDQRRLVTRAATHG